MTGSPTPLVGPNAPVVPVQGAVYRSVRTLPSMRTTITWEPGFTLIELVVAMALVGILLSLAIPSFRDSTLNSQRAARANTLVGDLTYARSQAVGLRRDIVLCRSSSSTSDSPACADGAGWEDGWIIFVDEDSDYAGDDGVADIETGEQILRVQEALISSTEQSRAATERFSIRGNTPVADEVIFDAGTGRANTVGTLVTCDSRDFAASRVVVISTAGRLQSFDTFDKATGARDSRVPASITTCRRS